MHLKCGGLIFIMLLAFSCSKSSKVEYTDEMPPVEAAKPQMINTVDQSTLNEKNPVSEQKN